MLYLSLVGESRMKQTYELLILDEKWKLL